MLRQKEQGLFELKGILHFTGGDVFSNANITDKKAVEILRANPNYIRQFTRYPENWMELIEEEVLIPKQRTYIQAGTSKSGNALFFFYDETAQMLKKCLMETGLTNGWSAATPEQIKN
jgi:hypothetical protein